MKKSNKVCSVNIPAISKIDEVRMQVTIGKPKNNMLPIYVQPYVLFNNKTVMVADQGKFFIDLLNYKLKREKVDRVPRVLSARDYKL